MVHLLWLKSLEISKMEIKKIINGGENMVEIIGSAMLVLVVYFFFDYQSKIKKLEKRIDELEKKLEREKI